MDIEKKENKTELIISKNQIYEIMNTSEINREKGKNKINETNKISKIKKEINEIYLKPEDIYYIIFTSGSTGVPKGVKVTYENIDSCIKWLQKVTQIHKGVILNQANFSFDLSVADLYLSLVSESEHFIINNISSLYFNKIFEQLKISNANLMVVTPSFIDLLLLDKSFGRELMPKLQTILFCGEKLSKSTVQKLYSRFSNIRIINCYGPTECTFAVTNIDIKKEFIEKENESTQMSEIYQSKNYGDIPVGRPKTDVKIYIVDENLNQLPEEEMGEILITGKSVANGYVKNTKSKAFIEYNGEKGYLTGDLGYIKNGILFYEARKDRQIKYKGYRIELSDIEKNLQSIDYIDKAVTVANTNKEEKVLGIISFVILKENSSKTELEIKKDLKNKVPEYMCSQIKIVKEFPLNQNGKCDTKKLLENLNC